MGLGSNVNESYKLEIFNCKPMSVSLISKLVVKVNPRNYMGCHGVGFLRQTKNLFGI
jgi:hypothetical protein